MSLFEAEPLLRNFLVEPDPTVILHTERYWRMIDFTAPSLVHPLIHNEVQVQKAQLADVRTRLEDYRQLASRLGRAVVADTNVYLNFQWENVAKWVAGANGKKASWIVPVVILDELDSKKYTSRSRQFADRARNVLKALDPLIARAIKTGGGFEIHTGIAFEVVADDVRRAHVADADAEILDRAVFLQQITSSAVTIISDDTGMMTRAVLRGLLVERPPGKYRHPLPANGTPAS